MKLYNRVYEKLDVVFKFVADSDEKTGLACDYYTPKDVSQNNFMKIKKELTSEVADPDLDTRIDTATEDFKKGNQKRLLNLCSEEKVMCKINSDFFPKDKKTLKTKIHYHRYVSMVTSDSNYIMEFTVFE